MAAPHSFAYKPLSNSFIQAAWRALPATLLAMIAALPAPGRAADAPPKAQSPRDSFGGCLRLGTAADAPAGAPCAARAAPPATPAAAAPVARTRRDLLPPPPPLPLLPPPPPLPPEPPPPAPEAREAGIDPLLYPPPAAEDAPPLAWTKEPAVPDAPLPEPTEAARAAPPPAPATQDGAVETVVLGAESLFELSSAALRPGARLELDALAAAIRAFPVRGVRVIGHSDRSGPAARNLRLSRQRAEAVRAHLVGQGIPASLIVAEGRGSAEPRTRPADCEGVERARLAACLQPDRRVEVEVRR